jgi:hypothetical protein
LDATRASVIIRPRVVFTHKMKIGKWLWWKFKNSTINFLRNHLAIINLSINLSIQRHEKRLPHSNIITDIVKWFLFVHSLFSLLVFGILFSHREPFHESISFMDKCLCVCMLVSECGYNCEQLMAFIQKLYHVWQILISIHKFS